MMDAMKKLLKEFYNEKLKKYEVIAENRPLKEMMKALVERVDEQEIMW